MTTRKNIVMVVTLDLAARNAPAIHTLNIAGQLASLGHQVTIVAPAFEGSPAVKLPGGNMCFIHSPNLSRWRLPNSLNTLLQLPFLFRLKDRPFLYIRSSPLSLPLVLLARLLRFRPFTVEFNGWFSDELKALGVNRFVASLFDFLQMSEARLAGKIRVVTPGLRDILTANNIPHSKVAVIENGADTDIFKPVDRKTGLQRLNLRDQTRYMAFIGNLWPPVDLETVFKALKLVIERGLKIELLIVGDGRSLANFAQLALETGVDQQVHFLGAMEQSELKYVLGAADFAIAPLHCERNERIGVSPLKVYEYAACGQPVIATRLPGISQLDAQHWISLVPPGDVEGWADQMIDYLSSHDLLKLQEEARSIAEKEFGWHRRAQQIDALISSQCRQNNQ